MADDMTRSRGTVSRRRIAIAAMGVLVAVVLIRLVAAESGSAPAVTARYDKKLGRIDIIEGKAPVLRYNFTAVPVPDRVKGRKYAEARGDYIHPLYGPAGEVLTVAYPNDHPHHRGVYWAWPEVYYKGGKRDLHALQGVFARPSRLIRSEGGSAAATIEAESIWKWGDTEPIVKEQVIIRAPRGEGAEGRLIDLEFRFTALVEGVSIARRGQTHYGGLNLRTTLHGGQKIAHHTDPPDARPRRNWGQIVGVPAGGKKPVSIAILEHASNPDYPGQWIKYPTIAWLQPTFPSKGRKFALPRDKPLVLKYRLWVRRGAANGEQLAEAWEAYNRDAGREEKRK